MKIGAFVLALLKRLFCRVSFWVLLLAIPAVTFAYAQSAQADAGIVTVALARDDRNDPLAKTTMEALPESSQLIRFVICDSREAARSLVAYGKADCAWVFHENMEENVKKFLRTQSQKDAFVTIYQRENMALLTLARERLNAAIYDTLAQELYLRKLTAESEALAAMEEDALLAFWENAQVPGELFAYTQTQGYDQPENHLTAPVRGLLAAVVLLGALGNSMYSKRDRETGTFSYLPSRLAFLPELIGGLWACLGLSLALGISLGVSGLAGPWWKELLCALGLAISCVSFSMALGRVFPKLSAMAALLPLVLCAALISSPIFFALPQLTALGRLFPLSGYLWAVTDFSRFPWMIFYSAVGFGIAFFPKSLSGRKAISE